MTPTHHEDTLERLKAFVTYASGLTGDEKGEAQVFCDRLFIAFGHAGYKEAGAVLEDRLKGVAGKKGTSFADLVWRPRLLLEMKRRGTNLRAYYQQAFDYWIRAVPQRPRYVVLCNFDEFWIYDFDRQIDQPMDIVPLEDLPRRYTALNFLFPKEAAPIFDNDREAVTREAADSVARVFGSMVRRGVPRETAQRFILQNVVAMFGEDIDLMPRGIVYRVLEDSMNGASSYDLYGGLFRQMNSPTRAPAGRYVDVPYYNGGLFSAVEPIELERVEAILLTSASKKDWSKVNPAIFGTLFQASMDAKDRHALGAHYTPEADILRVVTPTIVRPWDERIQTATKPEQIIALRRELHDFSVLDPACGSGNFLYVAYREIAGLEVRLLERLAGMLTPTKFRERVKGVWLVSPARFFGIERDSFGIELAKVTLMLAKKLALDAMTDALRRDQIDLPFDDDALPLDNLDANFICGDALFEAWPTTHVIIGNPPYQSKNKMAAEFGRAYLNRVRKRYPDVPGRADYCVYWFRRAHEELQPGGRAGLVGTNTIRQNYSREGGLDFIVANGGTITEAVATQVWTGDAVVHVSIVNWTKSDAPGKKLLLRQVGDDRDSPWESIEAAKINSSLSFEIDVSKATPLQANARSGGCYQGQTHGHPGFLLSRKDAEIEMRNRPSSREVLFPYLIAADLLVKPAASMRFVIDFGSRSMPEAQRYPSLFSRIERLVLQDKKARVAREDTRNAEALTAGPEAETRHHHQGALNRWWQLIWPRHELITAIARLPRYVVCGQVTKRPVFEFVSSAVRPNAALMVFPFADDYSFGVLQSDLHWTWFVNRCSTLKGDFRYTSNTVFDSFPWPQAPTDSQVSGVAEAARDLRHVRRTLQADGRTLRELYRDIEKPGDHPLKAAHEELDSAVRRCYGIGRDDEALPFLLALNQTLAEAERVGTTVRGPGLAYDSVQARRYTSGDCLLPSGEFGIAPAR